MEPDLIEDQGVGFTVDLGEQLRVDYVDVHAFSLDLILERREMAGAAFFCKRSLGSSCVWRFEQWNPRLRLRCPVGRHKE